MRRVICSFIFILLTASQQASSFTGFLTDTLQAFDGRRTIADRGSFEVRESWQGDSVTLEVTYLHLSATTPNPASPIVFLMGGPGVPASVIARVPPYFTLFDRLRATADVILLDQRGVGLSIPNLDCSPGEPPHPAFLRSSKDLFNALVATYQPCVSSLRSRGIPPELFTVARIAQDVETIREQLKVPRISLLGFSYGTRVALEYARLYPDRVDRIVLQGVLGFEHGVRLPSTLDSLLLRIDSLASHDSVARTLVQDVHLALIDQFKRLTHNPLLVPMRNTDGDTVSVIVGVEGFRALMSNHLTDPRLPALLYTLVQSDTRVLALMIEGIYRDLSGGGGSMFGRAVYASAPATEERTALSQQLAGSSIIGTIFDNMVTSTDFSTAIGILPGKPVGVPPRLGGEALLIEGSLDDRTPSGNASEMARLFSNSATVTVENGGHELLPASDVQQLVSDFFATGHVSQSKLIWPVPRFLNVEQALQPRRRPGR
jgi:pimeloyl-ACP methyl ester carboxylesterase